jgi:hypothetical protein
MYVLISAFSNSMLKTSGTVLSDSTRAVLQFVYSLVRYEQCVRTLCQRKQFPFLLRHEPRKNLFNSYRYDDERK